MIHRRILEIYDNKRTFRNSEKIYSFGIDKDNGINNLENDLLLVIKDMNKKGLININTLHNLIDFETSKLSLSNIHINLETPIKNLEENLKLISKEINHESI